MKVVGIEQSTVFVGKMRKIGVDLVDCSSGLGNWVKQDIPIKPGYQVCIKSSCVQRTKPHCVSQVPFAEALKKA